MNELERFKAIAHFEKPDYVPIFGFPGAPGMSGGCMKLTHDRLVATGMPSEVGGCHAKWQCRDTESWRRYWGATGPIGLDFGVAWGAEGFKTTTRIEDGFEIIESESGEITRQVVNNDITYSMPEFIRYPVRDRASWEFYKERTRPRQFMSREEIAERCKAYEHRDKPLCIGGGGTYGSIRSMMGTEAASYLLYDDPELFREMIDTELERVRRDVLPLIERLKPEVVACWEDLGFKNGMLLSPQHFLEFCGPLYREIADCGRANDVPVLTVDSDGSIMQFVDCLAECGFNAIYPCEVKPGNDLFALRQRHPQYVFFGWLEKETVNEGNEAMIEPEIMRKVPPLLEQGGYFPNGDHGLQPLVTFPSLCKFMSILHEVCNNPEGEFPRM